VVGGIVAVGAIPLNNFIYVFYGRGSICLFLVPLCIISLIGFASPVFLFNKKYANAAICFIEAAVLCAIVIPYGNNQPDNYQFFESVQASAFLRNNHGACQASAIEWSPGKKFGVCKKREDSGDPVYFRGIVYDSSDEILLPQEQRSQAWQKVALTVLPFTGGETYSSGLYGFKVRPIKDHFYYVTFDTIAGEAAHFF
jgi:hypothetical protein